MIQHIRMCIWTLIFLAVFVPIGDLYADDLSDTRKKEIVNQLYNNYKKDLPTIKDIKPSEVIRRLKQNKIVLIDVRTPAEMKVSMLPGAITKDEYLKKPDKSKGMTAIAYCTIGYRSGIFAEKMVSKGVAVQNLSGGLLAWVFEGGRVYHEKKEIKRIHVYGPKWNYPPSYYESVRFSLFERMF